MRPSRSLGEPLATNDAAESNEAYVSVQESEDVVADERRTREQRLADALEGLASAPRLLLLRELRTPKVLAEIELKFQPGGIEGRPPRNLARQTVREHLKRLLDVGAVVQRKTTGNRGPTMEYVVDHQTLFALAEEFRELATLRPVDELGGPTAAKSEPFQPLRQRGPCFVLVKGIEEGRTFDLSPTKSGAKQWRIGRSRGAEVSLDFDPYASSENAVVEWDGGLHVLRDLPDSRNGTTLNFEPLEKGERRTLATGDLVGVGRSILMFRG